MTIADEIMEQALEQNAAAVTPEVEAQEAPGKPAPAGFVDPLDEALFSDEALKDPATLKERANLLRAKCQGARFDDARMTYADLSHADVSLASFVGANLFRARFHGARDDDATFGPGRAVALGDDAPLADAERWRPAY